MPATQKDVARIAGVSQVVVSDVLRGNPRGRVSAETRWRILEATERLGYRPNSHARALRTRQSRQIAYVITEADVRQHDALGELALSGMAAALYEQEYQPLHPMRRPWRPSGR